MGLIHDVTKFFSDEEKALGANGIFQDTMLNYCDERLNIQSISENNFMRTE
jgi:hypothetical protein